MQGNHFGHQSTVPLAAIVAAMVTRRTRRIYLKEHREMQGISAEEMAERLGIERESVYRMEKKHVGVSSQKQAHYAAALGIEPEELWRPPDNPSLDKIISRASDDVRESIQTLIRNLIREPK